MVGTTVAAIIAATAAVLGGLLTAFATRSVERLRLRASLVEKAEERRLASIEEFMLLASDDLYRWLKETYLPMEYQVRETYVRQLRHGGPDSEKEPTTALAVTDKALAARRAFGALLRDDLVAQVRPEIRRLRDPLG